MADLFIKVRDKVNSNFQEMISRGDAIFMAPPTGQKLFVSYLTAFGGLVPANRSLIFRGYNTHACMACSKFINHFGFITRLEKTDNGFTRHTLWENMSDIIDGTEYDGLTPNPSEAGRYCYAPVTHKATLGYIVECLHTFHDQPQSLIMPAIPDLKSIKARRGPNDKEKR